MNKPRLFSVELETCHANSDGVAWYAYVENGVLDFADPAVEKEVRAAIKSNSAPLGVDEYQGADAKEVPNKLSAKGGLRRFYVASAG